ncbi:MAG: DUF2752 domain-containing protein [Planctomycetes bacterium]|nr:DUF2752 domain-containing protein [Planctomycetota bacterium]
MPEPRETTPQPDDLPIPRAHGALARRGRALIEHLASTPYLLVRLALLAGSVWLLATALSVPPDARGFGTHEALGQAPCSYQATTGRPCPTCGMTTAFANTVRGRLLPAFRASPAGLLLALLTIVAPGWLLVGLYQRSPVVPQFIARRPVSCLLALLLIGWASWGYKISQ